MNPSPGRVHAVCVGSGGIPKYAVASATLHELGFEGDAHHCSGHGGPRRAVCLFSIEDYRSLGADGVRAEPPGVFGENLVTEGIDYTTVRAGDRLELEGGAVLEVTDVREPCATLKPIDRRFPELLVGRSGFVCRVVHGGTVATGGRVTHRSDQSAPSQ